MDDSSLLDKIQDSFVDLLARGVDFLPKLLVAILLLFVGVIVARLVSKWIGKALGYIENHPTYKSSLKKLGMSVVSISSIVSLLARWTILIIFLSAAVDVLELTVLTDTFRAILDFVPNIFAAALIAGLSFIAGNVVHDIVYETAQKAKVSAYSSLAVASKVVILIFGIPLAASQLGLDLSIINNNLTVIVAGVMLALGIAFGLGGREVAGKIVNNLYEKMNNK
jgi:hypothetical protein